MTSDEPATSAADPGKAGKGTRKNDPATVHQLIKSLDPSDDERTALSKKISWILRHGASKKQVEVKIDDDGWVNVADLVGVEVLGTITEQNLMKVIIDSNGQKLRYEVKEDKKAKAMYVRAYSKDKRRSLENGSAPAPQAPQPPAASNAAAAAAAAGYLPGLGYHGGAAACAAAQQAAALAARQDPGALAAMMAQAQMSYAGLGAGMPPMFPPQYGGYWPPFFPPYSAYSGMAAAAAQSQAQQQQAAAGNASGRLLGRIKSYNSEKGFGFIECPVTKKQFDRDVFVHKAQISNFKVGDEVTFTVELSKQNWPQAKDLQYAGAGGYQQGGQGGGGKDGGRRKRTGQPGQQGEGKGGNTGKGKGKEKKERKDKKEGGGKGGGGGGKESKPAAAAAAATETPEAPEATEVAAPAAAEATSTA